MKFVILFRMTLNNVKKNDYKNIICINRENFGLVIKKNYLYKYEIPIHNITFFDIYIYDFNILIKN